MQDNKHYALDEITHKTRTFTIHRNRSLGEGGFAEVYLGTMRYSDIYTGGSHEQQVAIKTIHYTRSRTITAMREATMHSYISNSDTRNAFVAYIDAFENGTEYWIVMEYLKDYQTGEYIYTHTLRNIIRIMINTAKCVQELHAMNIMHRDLKPENIMIHHDTLHVKLIDFSFASYMLKYDVNKPCGTLGYADPNTLNLTPIPAKYLYTVDIYGLGATFYEFITGMHLINSGEFPPESVRNEFAAACRDNMREPIENSEKRILFQPLIDAMTCDDMHYRPHISAVIEYLEGIADILGVSNSGIDDETLELLVRAVADSIAPDISIATDIMDDSPMGEMPHTPDIIQVDEDIYLADVTKD